MPRKIFFTVMIFGSAVLGLFLFGSFRTPPARELSAPPLQPLPPATCIPRLDFPRAGKTLCVEIADEFSERIQGLSDRDALAPDSGMLFLFDTESSSLAFHMAGMRFPLDMLFLRLPSHSERSEESSSLSVDVVYIARNLPACFTPSGVEGPSRQNCASVQPQVPAQYVLEINAGKASEWGIGVGDVLVILMARAN